MVVRVAVENLVMPVEEVAEDSCRGFEARASVLEILGLRERGDE